MTDDPHRGLKQGGDEMSTDYETTKDLLSLVGWKVSVKEIRSWSEKRRDKIEDWAAAVHLEASDNIVRVPKRPRFKGVRDIS